MTSDTSWTCSRTSTAGTPRCGSTIRNSKRGSKPCELAFRMQAQAPEAFEVEKESEATKKLYGLDEAKTRGLRMAVPAGAQTGGTRRPVHPVHP